MPSTLAPRDRSATGFANPCKIGQAPVPRPNTKHETYVACLKARENQDVCQTCDWPRRLQLFSGHVDAQCRIELQITLFCEMRNSAQNFFRSVLHEADEGCALPWLENDNMRHSRLDVQQCFGALGASNRNVRELHMLGSTNRTVGEH